MSILMVSKLKMLRILKNEDITQHYVNQISRFIGVKFRLFWNIDKKPNYGNQSKLVDGDHFPIIQKLGQYIMLCKTGEMKARTHPGGNALKNAAENYRRNAAENAAKIPRKKCSRIMLRKRQGKCLEECRRKCWEKRRSERKTPVPEGWFLRHRCWSCSW